MLFRGPRLVLLCGPYYTVIIILYDRTIIDYIIHAKTAKVYKGCGLKKAWVKKSCEVQGGSHGMAAMMLMVIKF